jgi:hypothetical protein
MKYGSHTQRGSENIQQGQERLGLDHFQMFQRAPCFSVHNIVQFRCIWMNMRFSYIVTDAPSGNSFKILKDIIIRQ